MGLAEVAQAPGEVTDDGGGGDAGDHVEVGRVALTVGVGAVVVGRGPAPDVRGVVQGDERHDRNDDEGREHDHALHGVGVGHGEEAADEGVGDGDGRDDEHAVEVLAAEGRLEVAAAGDHAGGHVEGEEEDDDDRRDDAQRTRAVVHAVLEEARQRDGVVGHLGVGTQARRDPHPVGPRTDEQTDGDPQLTHASDEQRARQTHEQPTRHVGGAGGHRGDKGVELTVREDIIVVLVGLGVAPVTDREHQSHVEDDGDDEPR